MATPPTPDLTAEGGTTSIKNDNNNGTSSPTNGKAIVFDSGKASGKNGNGQNNGKGKKSKKSRKTSNNRSNNDSPIHNDISVNGHKHTHDEDSVASGTASDRPQKKNKSKKSQKTSNHANNNNGSNTDSPINSSNNGHVNGHKHAHDEDSEVEGTVSSRPQKKQRSKDKRQSSWTDSALNLIYFALGMCFTLPLLFSSCAYVGCGGKSNVNSMVDMVLLEKSRDGEGETSFDDMMQYLKASRVPNHNAFAVEEKSQTKSKRKRGEKSNLAEASGNDEVLESMCQVSFIVIGNFVHHLPYAQWLVLRNPFISVTSENATTMEGSQEDEDKRRKGMFQRVTAKHKKKHHEHESTSAASEEIDRKHPLRHILEGASIFNHHRKQRKMERKQKKLQQAGKKDGGEREVDWKKWKYAMSDDYELKSDEVSLIKELANRVTVKAKNTVCKDSNVTDCIEAEKQIVSLSGGSNMPNRPFQERLDAVSWGGINADSTRWWPRKDTKDDKKISAQSEGGRILTAYLKIMKWPKDLYVKYPFRLCAKGCDSEVSLLHTLEWREKYKPWCVSDKSVQFNKAGFIYSRGHSRPGPKQRLEAEKTKDATILVNAGHSMVWYRPGLASPSEDPELYGRTMINALEMAVSDSLVRNKGTIGRFNVIMDCSEMKSTNSPSIASVKKLFSVLQDHFPDRLGVLLAANLSGLTQMLMKMVLPFVTEDVRSKIHLIPNDEPERGEMLAQFMDEEHIPYYLGGKDEYRFNPREYHEGKCILPEEGITEYHTTMPYHA